MSTADGTQLLCWRIGKTLNDRNKVSIIFNRDLNAFMNKYNKNMPHTVLHALNRKIIKGKNDIFPNPDSPGFLIPFIYKTEKDKPDKYDNLVFCLCVDEMKRIRNLVNFKLFYDDYLVHHEHYYSGDVDIDQKLIATLKQVFLCIMDPRYFVVQNELVKI